MIMNPIEKLDMHCEAMQKKYGIQYCMKMTKEELKLHTTLIDQAKEYWNNGGHK